MSALTTPTREQAESCVRVFGYLDALLGAQLSATAGQTPIRITSLPMAASFLSPIDEVDAEDLHTTINFINPLKLAGWVRTTIGDIDLADELDAIASDGRAFGYQVRDIKPLLIERLGQYAVAMGLVAPAATETVAH